MQIHQYILIFQKFSNLIQIVYPPTLSLFFSHTHSQFIVENPLI